MQMCGECGRELTAYEVAIRELDKSRAEVERLKEENLRLTRERNLDMRWCSGDMVRLQNLLYGHTKDGGNIIDAASDRIEKLQAEVAGYQLPYVVTNDKCTDCGCILLYSSREIGDGLCHCCAHKKLAFTREKLKESDQERSYFKTHLDRCQRELGKRNAALDLARARIAALEENGIAEVLMSELEDLRDKVKRFEMRKHSDELDWIYEAEKVQWINPIFADEVACEVDYLQQELYTARMAQDALAKELKAAIPHPHHTTCSSRDPIGGRGCVCAVVNRYLYQEDMQDRDRMHRLLCGGAALVATDRRRQVTDEHFGPGHDDDHRNGELIDAAMCYLGAPCVVWPWSDEWWKPKDTLHNLVVAGALICAEIDRLKRAEEQEEDQDDE